MPASMVLAHRYYVIPARTRAYARAGAMHGTIYTDMYTCTGTCMYVRSLAWHGTIITHMYMYMYRSYVGSDVLGPLSHASY